MSKTKEINTAMKRIKVWIKLDTVEQETLKLILSSLYNHAKEDGAIETAERFNIGK